MQRSLWPSPAMVVAVIALGVATSGVAWAATKIDTAQLKRGAVTTKKLAGSAVKASKLAAESVTSAKLGPGAVDDESLASGIDGVAMAGVRVGPAGETGSWFNRAGGEPVVQRTDVGVYRIGFPGVETDSRELPVATLDGMPGQISTDFEVHSAGATLRVFTAAPDGTPEDRRFTLLLFGADSLPG